MQGRTVTKWPESLHRTKNDWAPSYSGACSSDLTSWCHSILTTWGSGCYVPKCSQKSDPLSFLNFQYEESTHPDPRYNALALKTPELLGSAAKDLRKDLIQILK